ncbi:hypothetical protein R3P38DRAFT_2840498 [Favolaschia claudopus]|uniref:Yeast cell wall synthesis Kre9/Knh1-like N-terminal domain-containing protein n=1 Tax=Favolaschia claudopus TaxID=2862362 RepID=A0AAW0DWF3_9AGAR
MFSLSSSVVALTLASSAFAALFVTSPTETIGFTAGQPANISWQDSADQPALASFGLAKVSIYVGNSISQTSLQTISESVDPTNPMFITFTPDASIGPNSNQYFIRFESLTNKDPTQPTIPLLAFSHIFTMSGMTGAFSNEVQAQINGQSTAPIGGTAAAAAASTKPSATLTSKSSTPSHSASKSAQAATVSGSSAAVPTFAARSTTFWLGIVTGVLGAVVGAAIL